MTVLLLLGENDKYLGYKSFTYKYQAELFVDSIQDLMISNIEKVTPLKERLKLSPSYFPYAGLVQETVLIDLNEKGEEENG
jgi:hypothetical protein